MRRELGHLEALGLVQRDLTPRVENLFLRDTFRGIKTAIFASGGRMQGDLWQLRFTLKILLKQLKVLGSFNIFLTFYNWIFTIRQVCIRHS